MIRCLDYHPRKGLKYKKINGKYKVSLRWGLLSAWKETANKVNGRYIEFQLPPFQGLNAMEKYRERCEKYLTGVPKLSQIKVKTIFEIMGVRDEFRSKAQSREIWDEVIVPTMEKCKLKLCLSKSL